MKLQGFSKREIGQIIAVLARAGMSQDYIVTTFQFWGVKKACEYLIEAGYLRWDNIPGWKRGLCKNARASVKAVRDYLDKFEENAQQDGLTQEQGIVVRECLTTWLQKREQTTVSYRGCHAPCDRRTVVRRLYCLGIQRKTIARITGYDYQVVRIDLLGYEKTHDENAVYGNVLVEYAKCLAHLEAKTVPEPGIEDVHWYLEVLERFLEKRELLAYCLGVEQTARALSVPQYTPAQKPYVLLYLDMVETYADKPHARPDLRKQIRERFDCYAKQVAEGALPPPKDKWEVSTYLLHEVTDHLRGQVWPVWKQEWCDALDKMMGELSADRLHIIRLRYGFDGPPYTIAQIVQKTDDLRSRIKELLVSARNHMKRTGAFFLLSCETVPLGQIDHARKRLEEQLAESLELIKQMREDPLTSNEARPILDARTKDFLLSRLDDLELSVRARNCLRNQNVTFVYELVEKTEEWLLKTKNFGRKCLNEVKEYLAEHGLSLGMRLPKYWIEQ
jgi:hypothetical protein